MLRSSAETLGTRERFRAIEVRRKRVKGLSGSNMPEPEISFSFCQSPFLVIGHTWTNQDGVPKLKNRNKKEAGREGETETNVKIKNNI